MDERNSSGFSLPGSSGCCSRDGVKGLQMTSLGPAPGAGEGGRNGRNVVLEMRNNTWDEALPK